MKKQIRIIRKIVTLSGPFVKILANKPKNITVLNVPIFKFESSTPYIKTTINKKNAIEIDEITDEISNVVHSF